MLCREGSLLLQWLSLVLSTAGHFCLCGSICRDTKYCFLGEVFGLHWGAVVPSSFSSGESSSFAVYVFITWAPGNLYCCPLCFLRVWEDYVWGCSPSSSQIHDVPFFFMGIRTLACLFSLKISNSEVDQSIWGSYTPPKTSCYLKKPFIVLFQW